jgi:NADPH:quinone reductase-like Zn-dependent oxidoreductase
LKPPRILGSDFAGEITAIGSQVNDYRVGDAVWGKFDSFKGGSYAQQVVARPENIGPKPSNLDFQQAASMPNVALTALQALVHKGHLQAEQAVLVNGASGGVGLMAVQIAKALDCHVTAVCSQKNQALVQSMGADVVLDYQTEDILAQHNAHDVFFDCVANQAYFKVRKTLKNGGVHVKTTPDLMSLLGQVLRPLISKVPDHIMVKPSHADLEQLRTWVEAGQLKPVIAEVFPMADVAAAHEMSQAGRVVGKLVLDLA